MHINTQSLWKTLARGEKPVVLYGIGDGADKILDYCGRHGIKVADIFASDDFVRGDIPKFFRGYRIKKLSEIKALYGENFCVLLSFATRFDIVLEKIYALDDSCEFYVPNFPVFGENIYFDSEYHAQNREEIECAYDLWADDESRCVYENAINFCITGKLDYLKADIMQSPKEPALDLFDLRDICYIDLGAYDGDTIFELFQYSERNAQTRIKKIHAFEPDTKNFMKLQRNTAQISDICELYNLGAWSHADTLSFNAQSNRNSNFDSSRAGAKIQTVSVDSIDNLLYTQISGDILIKYDIEGAEFEALTGSQKIIREYSPNLIVSLYHKTGDIFKLPLYIHSMNPQYKLYLRKHKYVPCWDLNLYAVK